MTTTALRATTRREIDTALGATPGGPPWPTIQAPQPSGLTRDEIRQIVLDILG